MELVGDVVRKLVAESPRSAVGVARGAGVSTSTLYRVLNSRVDPSVGTLREIALACGRELVLATTPPSDPDAASAARSLLEDGYPTPAGPGIAAWEDRLMRLSDDDTPVSLVQTAAAYSSPLRRVGVALFSGSVTVGRLASAGEASGRSWALSGAAGLYLPEHTEPAPAVTILWCSDVRAVAQLLADSPLNRTDRADRASVAVIEAEPELFTGAFTRGIVTYAAPIQIILDCLAQPGSVAADALAEARTW